MRSPKLPRRRRRSRRRLARSRRSRPRWLRHQHRHAQKSPRLGERLAHIDVTATGRDHIEQVAMFAARGIGPFARPAARLTRRRQEKVKAATGRPPDIADKPVAAFAATVGEIVAAHGLGIFGEAARQFTGWTFHAGLLQRPCARADVDRKAIGDPHGQLGTGSPCQRLERRFLTNGTSESSMTCPPIQRREPRNRQRRSRSKDGGHYRLAGYSADAAHQVGTSGR